MDKDPVEAVNNVDYPNDMTLTCHCVNDKGKIEILPPEPSEPEKTNWPFWLIP